MIVDDDALVRLGLADLLDGDPGIAVAAQAADGLQAIEQATAHHIDVALVDVCMPHMDGITATARLRQAPRHHHRREGGQHPSPATVMRMLREHDEQAATAAGA